MKKILCLVLFITLASSLAACDQMGDAGTYDSGAETSKKAETTASADKSGGSPTPKPPIWTADDPSFGSPSAPISMVVFSDFQCPFCANFFQSLEMLQKDWIDSGKLKIQYRDFPLSIHKNSQPAHLAANAAAKQGKYLEMHRKLFQQQKAWEKNQQPKVVFEQFASEVGLNLDQYRKDVESAELQDEMIQDRNEGAMLGISGTPGFFLNGVAYEGAVKYDDLVKLLGDLQK